MCGVTIYLKETYTTYVVRELLTFIMKSPVISLCSFINYGFNELYFQSLKPPLMSLVYSI